MSVQAACCAVPCVALQRLPLSSFAMGSQSAQRVWPKAWPWFEEVQFLVLIVGLSSRGFARAVWSLTGFLIFSGGGRRGVPWCRDAMAAAQGFAEARGSLGYNRAWQSRTTASMGAAQASLPAALACCDGLEYRSPVWIGAVR